MSFEDPADVEHLNEELQNFKTLRHPHLVRLIDFYTVGDFFYIFMLPVADGNLTSFFRTSHNEDSSQSLMKQKSLLLEWMSCLQSAVAYLHNQNIIHEDLNPDNILIKENTIFLTNLKDLMRFVTPELAGIGRPNTRSMYCAPETMIYGIIDAKSNTFSLGCVFAEILTFYFDGSLSGFENFRASETGDLPYHLNLERTNKWIDLLANKHPWADSSPDYSPFKMLYAMLTESSLERPSAHAIQLGIKQIIRELATKRSPERPRDPEIQPDATKVVEEKITEELLEGPGVPEIYVGMNEVSQDKIIETLPNNSPQGKIEWNAHCPRMVEVGNRFVEHGRPWGHYRHSSDGYTEAEIDADGEVVDELEDDVQEVEHPIAEEEEDQDTDYKPKASRNKRRRSSRTNRVSPSAPASKRSKVTKSVQRSKSQFQCKTCDHSAKDATALHKHVQAAHTRPYVCTFSFAGCGSAFGNKNEWKRHVYSQHLSLQYWLCHVGACSNSKASTSRSSSSNSNSRTKNGGNEFNRKDLFTQHLRRMHTPFPVKRAQKKSPEWEERIKELQVNCLMVRRTAPQKTKCPVRTCGQLFEGTTSWDDMMEHVGRHLEKASATSNGPTVNDIVEQESDEFIIEWALREKIIERKTSGGYRLYSNAGPTNDEDADADAEFEDY